jgi:putative transcriptional regulator
MNGTMPIQFRLRELMAEKARVTGQSVTYETIYEAKQISPNTLSKMARNKLNKVGINTIDDLCDYFNCEPGDLIVRVKGK